MKDLNKWDEIKRKRKNHYIAFLGIPLLLIGGPHFGIRNEMLLLVTFGYFFVPLALGIDAAMTCKCPQCGRLFFYKSTPWLGTSHCAWCEIKINAKIEEN